MELTINKTDWEQWLEVKGLSQKTIKEYNSYYDKLDLSDFTQTSAITFLQSHNNIVAKAFLNNLITFVKMGDYQDHVKVFMRTIELPKVTGRKKKRIPDILTEEQVLQLSNKMKIERSQLMALISFYGGLRVSELVQTNDNEEYALRPYSFNWSSWIKNPEKNGVVTLIGKGNKQRKVFMPQKVMARIYQYIKNEVSKKQGKNEPIFNIGERRWKKILADESMRILGRHVNPHLLRHSCNQWLRTRGWDVTERQQYLGHEHPTTTMKYDHTNQDNIKEKFNQLF